jgi:peptidyl-prolyl cis-trans isomerase SurA
MLRQMIPSKPFQLSAILILGVTFTASSGWSQTSANSATEPQPVTPNAHVVEDIVARVNDQVITRSDYDRELQQLEAEARQQGLSPQELDDRKKNLLRDLIDQQLLLSKGKDLGITGESELVRRLDEIRKQNHLDSMEDLEKAAAQQGVSYEDFKAKIRNDIITQQVVRDEVSKTVRLGQADVEAYYKAHASEFTQPESVHLSEILIPTPADADASQVAAAQAKADDLEAKLKAGANFADMAKASSSGPTAAQGGDLGEFRRGSLAPVLEQKTFSLSAGQFTEPIRTKQGFVILQTTQHHPGGAASLKEVEPEVEQAVFVEHMQPALRRYLTKLREEAYIELPAGFVDTGASPNEIHVLNTAYEPPGPKKKKKFARTRYRGRTRSTKTAAQTAVVTGTAGTSSGTATASTATPSKTTQEASNNNQSIQTPGKKEKIRFGQAPRESLPAAQTLTESAPAPANAPAKSEPAGTTQTASVSSSTVQYADGMAPVQEPSKTEKTRFSDRAKVKKVKEPKSTAAPDTSQEPTADELANQKVQDAPLDLNTQADAKKKPKQKGEKTRYSARPKGPEKPEQQPYMGTPPPSATAQPANGNQPAGGTQPSNGAQPSTETPPATNSAPPSNGPPSPQS